MPDKTTSVVIPEYWPCSEAEETIAPILQRYCKLSQEEMVKIKELAWLWELQFPRGSGGIDQEAEVLYEAAIKYYAAVRPRIEKAFKIYLAGITNLGQLYAWQSTLYATMEFAALKS